MQYTVSDKWRKKIDCGTRMWRAMSMSWYVLSSETGLVCTSCLNLRRQDSLSCGAHCHQWDHFCIHLKLLIRISWIFKYLSPLICLTISILSLGLFCCFSLLHIYSVSHTLLSDVTSFETIPNIPSSWKGWISSLLWLPALPFSFYLQRWVGGGTACKVPLWELASSFLKFILIIIIQCMCLSLHILQRDFISSCFTVLLSANAKCWHSVLNGAMSLFLLNI